MKKIQSNSVVLSLIAFELKLVLILHEMNFKIIIGKQGQASCFILLEQNETTQKNRPHNSKIFSKVCKYKS